jgi:hypothetical protein
MYFMIQKIFYLPIILSLSISCEVSLPNTSVGSGSDAKTNLRVVNITCSEASNCKSRQGDNLSSFVFYTSDKCSDLDASSPILAQAKKDLSCADNTNCQGKVSNFLDENNEEKTIILETGKYTLVSFVDLDANEFYDSGEPFYCNEEIELSISKRLTEIYIEINQVY